MSVDKMLDGQVIVVTGAGRGIGRAIAIRLAAAGAKVVVNDLGVSADGEGTDTSPATEVVKEISDLGGVAIANYDSVAEWDSAHEIIQTAIDNFGRIDGLVNNAGIVLRKGIEDTTEEEWDRVMAVNSKGVFLGTKAAIPAMRQAGGGSIVNISSTAGLVGSGQGLAAYSATKGSVRLFTKSTAIQHARDNIRCNSVHPGPIDTPMLREAWGDTDRREERITRVPLGRIGTTDDIAYGVLFLASDEASFMTGSELVIDGGSTAQ